MEETTDYRANEKLKKKRYRRIRATFNEWKKGRALRIPVAAVATFILGAGVKLYAAEKPSKSLFLISAVLFLVWYVMRIAHAKVPYVVVKAREDEIVQIAANNFVYAYKTRMDPSNIGQQVTVMMTMQKNDIKDIVEMTKPRRLEVTGTFLRQICTAEQFLNRHDPSVKIKKGTREKGTLVLYDYYNKADAMFSGIKDIHK